MSKMINEGITLSELVSVYEIVADETRKQVLFSYHEENKKTKKVELVSITNDRFIEFLLTYASSLSISSFFQPEKIKELAESINKEEQILKSVLGLTATIKTRLLTFTTINDLVDIAVKGYIDLAGTSKSVFLKEPNNLIREETMKQINVGVEDIKTLLHSNHWLLVLYFVALSGYINELK